MQIAPFKLERYFAKYEFSTQYLLCSSDCESMTVQELLSLEPGAGDEFGSQWLGYTDFVARTAGLKYPRRFAFASLQGLKVQSWGSWTGYTPTKRTTRV